MHEWDERSFDWPLTRDGSVVEIGAYKGRWCSEIADRYGCKVFAYEPQPWAFAILEEEARNRPNLIPFNYAIGTHDGEFPMGEWATDACSFLHVGVREQGVGRMREASQVFGELVQYGRIDLVMLNIEGYEYYLIPYLLNMGVGSIIERFCVQWHNFVDESGARYKTICEQLRAEGFELLWSYGPTLEAWSK